MKLDDFLLKLEQQPHRDAIRVEFAKAALTGLLAGGWDGYDEIPGVAVKLADDMLKALEQKP